MSSQKMGEWAGKANRVIPRGRGVETSEPAGSGSDEARPQAPGPGDPGGFGA